MAEARRGLSVRPLLVELGRDYRGGQHQAFLLLEGLLARGHAPELITVRHSLLARRARSAGVNVSQVGKRWRHPAAALAIRHLVAQRRVDLIHANEPHALTAAWLAGAHRHVPLVASRRVIFPLSRNIPSLTRYRAAAQIIAVSQCAANAVVAANFPRDRITVIPDGVPVPPTRPVADRAAARRRFEIAADAPLAGCVAVLTPDKGQETLVRALAALRPKVPDCQLLLVGDGPCGAKLRSLVREQGLAGAVHFAGFVEDLDSAYAAMDLFVFPARAEALGSALLSAMAHGLPVVALARGGIPEVVEDGSNGLLIPEPDPGALAAAMASLLSNPARADRLGEAARTTVFERFSVGRMVDATLRLYERMTKEYRTGRR